MKIQYISDLHMELHDNSNYLSKMPIIPTGDVLVIAGDIAYLSQPVMPLKKFWDWASENYREVLLIPGNHEYYGATNLLEHGPAWERRIRPNVAYYNNLVVRVDDTDFIMTTLWSDIDLSKGDEIRMGINDFHRIICGREHITPQDFHDEYERCLDFLKESVEESDAKHIVVVTHHLPSMQVVAPCHKNSPLISAFASNLDRWIKKSKIDYWIYGHSHTNIDATIGRTRVVSNQLGYVQFNEHHAFDPGRYFTLD